MALIGKLKSSLSELEDAMKGTIVMSLELEEIYNKFLLKKVPETWQFYSYLSLKSLGSWFTDLIKRFKFFKDWNERVELERYWVSAFYFPQGFMTAVLQQYSRKNLIPIDSLVFQTTVTDEPREFSVIIYGLYLEGCGWNVERGQLQESNPGELFQEMPGLRLTPVAFDQYAPQNVYECPVYKTTERRGELSTTGHSTNFVLSVHLTSLKPENYWTNMGVALILQLS